MVRALGLIAIKIVSYGSADHARHQCQGLDDATRQILPSMVAANEPYHQ